MVAVHDGTANINKRSVINVKCVNCKNCIGYDGMYGGYYCQMPDGGIEYVEECIANNDEMGCEFFVEDSDDDFTA